MPVIDIDINHNAVVIEGVRIPRPNGIAVSTWVKYWSEVKRGTYEEGYSRGYNDGERDAQDRDRGH